MERWPDMTEDVNYVEAHEQVVKCAFTACLYSSTDLSIEHIQCTEYVTNALLQYLESIFLIKKSQV